MHCGKYSIPPLVPISVESGQATSLLLNFRTVVLQPGATQLENRPYPTGKNKGSEKEKKGKGKERKEKRERKVENEGKKKEEGKKRRMKGKKKREKTKRERKFYQKNTKSIKSTKITTMQFTNGSKLMSF